MNSKKIRLFRTQLFYMLFPIVFLPALLVGFFSYQVSFDALQSRTTHDVERISDLVNQNLDTVVGNMVQLSKSPLYDSDIQKILTYYSQNPEITYPEPNDVTIMDRFLYNLESSNKAIQSVFIYSQGNVYFSASFTGSTAGDQDWKQRQWFRDAIAANDNKNILIPTQQVSNYSYGGDSLQSSVFSVVRQIKNTSTFEVAGSILINIDISVIKQVIETSQENSDTKFIVFDSENQWIYPAQGDAFRAEMGDLSTVKQVLPLKNKAFSWKGTQYFMSSNKSDYSNWTVAAMIPKSSLTRSIQSIKWTTFTVVCLTLCLSLILFFILITRISNPVTQLRKLIKRLEMGDLDVRFISKGGGEIVMLGQSFNQMVSRLKELIQDNYESRILRQRAELSALRSQLNPHFLYNTLESFQMIAITEGNERLARMSNALGQLMRCSLQVDETISLEQELLHIRNYLALIKERYEDRLIYQIDIPEEMLHYQIPKLTLQPLVENAVYHGIDAKIGIGHISIIGYENVDQFVVEIIDDGVGMPPDKLGLIQHELSGNYNALERPNHIGMLNIQAQIKGQFGPDYGITIEAIETGGLKVRLSLPNSMNQSD